MQYTPVRLPLHAAPVSLLTHRSVPDTRAYVGHTRVSELVPCSSFAGAFQCDTGADGAKSGSCKPCAGSNDGCVPCEVVMLAVTRRGFAVTHSLDKLQALQPQPQSQSQMKHAEL